MAPSASPVSLSTVGTDYFSGLFKVNQECLHAGLLNPRCPAISSLSQRRSLYFCSDSCSLLSSAAQRTSFLSSSPSPFQRGMAGSIQVYCLLFWDPSLRSISSCRHSTASELPILELLLAWFIFRFQYRHLAGLRCFAQGKLEQSDTDCHYGLRSGRRQSSVP